MKARILVITSILGVLALFLSGTAHPFAVQAAARPERSTAGALPEGAFAALQTGTASLPPLQNIATIAAGYAHTCAVTAGGGVQCWGYNRFGQLGDGTTNNSNMPVDVSGLSSGVVAIAAGEYHTCAVTTGGGVQCWGRNASGQLGDGTTNDSNVPVGVSGLSSGVAAVVAGEDHTCALTTGGGVKCWGWNWFGQLGDGTNTWSPVPVAVSGLSSGVVAVAAGYDYTCALTTGGGVQCWGANWSGQLGDGTTNESHVPVAVSGLSSGVVTVAAGEYHTCAVTTGGGVQCWGYNEYGQLGDGAFGYATLPVAVSGLSSGVAAVAAGWSHTCAVTTGGGVQCWGDNWSGQLGDGTTNDSAVPVAVSGLSSGVVAVAAGLYHTCAVTTGGGVQCWGWNGSGQLGDGTNTSSNVPVDVSGLSSGVVAIAVGDYHTCAATTGGGVQCWGRNDYGQLGNETTNDSNVPVAVSGLSSGVVAIAAGYGHTCALTAGGGVQCWGRNGSGELGDGTTNDSSVPVAVSGLSSGVVAVAAGDDHTCALITGGGVQCWGLNDSGQLGDGTTNDSNVPVAVSGLSSGVAAIAAGDWYTCAVTTGGGVKCWGANWFGQLGDGTTTNSNVPVAVSGLASRMAVVAASGDHTCAVTTGGGVQCWGDNLYGQLGNGAFGYATTPVAVVSALEVYLPLIMR